MQYLPVRCDDHGWLLLDAESVPPREKHIIECEGHMITRDTHDVALVETTEYLQKTRGLADDEFKALILQAKV